MNYNGYEGSRQQLEDVKEQGGWIAPSIFYTHRGGRFCLMEAACYHHEPETGKMDGYDAIRVEGDSYKECMRNFWKAWNSTHRGQKLNVLKFMSSTW